MKQACHVLLKIGFILDIVCTALFAVLGTIMIAAGVTAAASGSSVASTAGVISGAGVLTMGIVYLCMVPLFVVGIVLSKIGLQRTEMNQETIGFGVCLIIFAFVPARILYIICAANNPGRA